MSNRGLAYFLIFLPAIIAVCHDFYLFTENSRVEDIEKAIMEGEPPVVAFFADLGFIWTKYHQESYRWVASSLPEDQWAIINFFLTQKAFFVGIGLGVLAYILEFILTWLGLFSGSASDSNKPVSKAKGKRFKYKRR